MKKQLRLPRITALSSLLVATVQMSCSSTGPAGGEGPGPVRGTGGAPNTGGQSAPTGTGGNQPASTGGAPGAGGGVPAGTGGTPASSGGTSGDSGSDSPAVDASADSPTPMSPSAIPPTGLGPWTGNDNVPPSPQPPGGFAPAQVPMFVSFGFDDNPENDGMNWAVSAFSALKNPAGTGKAATHDGTTVKATFYHTSIYVAAASSWKAAHAAGFETGNHTVHHYHGAGGPEGMNFNQAGWTREIEGCNTFLTGPMVGIPKAEIYGFRTPFLQYNGDLFPVLRPLGFWYDCSISEGHQPEMDGTNYYWPYTLDGGSPGHKTNVQNKPAINTWPKGLWEMPAYRVIVPPDADAAKYGIPPGLRGKLAKLRPDRFSDASPKITGLDYDLFYDYLLTKDEFVATLKHTLDLRLAGNRAPLLFGMHSAIYSANAVPGTRATLAERRQAIVDVLKYALGFPDVRVVTTKAVLDWIRNPVPLR